ncbi:protein phosphatase regulator [Neonectria punicea]|uniref:Protein phosphatase regulator n=1 Tax=Neonectria punicea TaxID=979145 RepID=A0ABR1HJL8_9HYPO
MAVVLSSDDNGYFAASSLRRSHSSSFVTSSSAFSAASRLNDAYNSPSKTYSDSTHSSAPSSPRTIHADSSDLSCVSTPATNLSIASEYDDHLGLADSPEDHFMFPSFAQEKLFVHPQLHPDDNLEPPPSPRTGDSYTVSPADHESSDDGSHDDSHDASNDTSRPGTPEFGDHAEDDTAISTRPSRQVDYLSHEWQEEDIWSSWRYIVTRRGEFANSARLENASWRTWMKAKNGLKTISPESLNWLKDCDVTWLYGPLQSGNRPIHDTQTDPSSVSLSKTGSLINLHKKPILKKRSMSEVMLQRSLSTASLLKQATAAVQAQETRGILRPRMGRSATDYFAYPFSSRRMSGESSSVVPSTESSGIISPSTERKHIHFNESVEQCIAVDVKGEDDEEVTVDSDHYDDDSDSDDGVMMKRMTTKKRPVLKTRVSKTKTVEGKTIAKLPSTTLKYREDTPEPKETAMKHSRSPLMSPSSSQETLRPAKHSGKFFFGEEDDEEGLDDALLSPTGWSSPPPNGGGLQRSMSSSSLLDDPAGMRRTPSGMLMPYEEGDPANGEGIFGRVIDTVNTARDIAHVIWNVGWRK